MDVCTLEDEMFKQPKPSNICQRPYGTHKRCVCFGEPLIIHPANGNDDHYVSFSFHVTNVCDVYNHLFSKTIKSYYATFAKDLYYK